VQLFNGLNKISGIKIIGRDFTSTHRTPTISFLAEGKTPAQVCAWLAKKNICAWDGHFYAIRAIEVLGLLEKGGVTRLGISFYNTAEEINTTLAEIESLANHDR
jgi:selenocysteine lyase/cysteine desulfurase